MPKQLHPSPDLKTTFSEGLTAAWPIWLGYVPIGLAFGVVAQKAGLGPVDIALMSLIVFAGSAQFIAVAMIGSGAGVLSIVATTFAVNLRHLLMSSSLAVFFRGVKKSRLSLLAYGVTDESFAVNLARFNSGSWDLNRSLVVNHTANLVWIASTVLGGYTGEFIPQGAFGIDYALVAMFICLLVFQLRGRIYVVTALLAGVIAVALSLWIPGNSYIVAASSMAAAIGVVLRKRER
jgi:4-azaleucine resistance transporter AzlC